MGEPTSDDPRPAHPPKWCIGAIHARGHWPSIRRLDAIVDHPVLMNDGSLLFTDGYDPSSALLVRMPRGLSVPVPAQPTGADVAAAVATLNEVIVDFPFSSPAHRASWYAGLLTPLAWFAFNGPAPLFLFDSNVRGTGKGLLADVISLILNGRRFATMAYTSDQEELRKKITSMAVQSDRMVLLDNLPGEIGNAVLDQALTSSHWRDRLLGSNKMFDGPLDVCWFATGNNVQMKGDTSRRVCHCRMETMKEKPEKRKDFRYMELREHVLANRGDLLASALTILRGWVVAGRPKHQLQAWGSYESWSSVVREAIVFANLPDPGETREALQAVADPEQQNMTTILRCLEQMDPSGIGLTAGEIFAKLKTPLATVPAWHADMMSAVEDLCGFDARKLGYTFRASLRRNLGGRLLDHADQNRNGTNRWRVSRANEASQLQPSPSTAPPPPSAGDAGDAGDGSGRCDSADPTLVSNRQVEPGGTTASSTETASTA